MAEKKFTQLPPASAVFAGDIFAVVQGGVSKQATIAQAAAVIGAAYVPYAGASADVDMGVHSIYASGIGIGTTTPRADFDLVWNPGSHDIGFIVSNGTNGIYCDTFGLAFDYDTASDSFVNINYRGFQGTADYYRGTIIYNGKGNRIATFNGSVAGVSSVSIGDGDTNTKGSAIFWDANGHQLTVTVPTTISSWTMTLPTGPGSSNQPIVSNGAGVTSWSSVVSISRIPNLPTNGFVKTSSLDGTLSIDTSTYLTAAITSLNGLTGAVQTFATPGTTGTAPNWSSGTTIHTLNIPLAAAAGVTAGLISKTQYDSFVAGATQWTTSGSNIYRATGQVGIGTTTFASGSFTLQVGDGSADSRIAVFSNTIFNFGMNSGGGTAYMGTTSHATPHVVWTHNGTQRTVFYGNGDVDIAGGLNLNASKWVYSTSAKSVVLTDSASAQSVSQSIINTNAAGYANLSIVRNSSVGIEFNVYGSSWSGSGGLDVASHFVINSGMATDIFVGANTFNIYQGTTGSPLLRLGLSNTGNLSIPNGTITTVAPGGAAAAIAFGGIVLGAVTLKLTEYWETTIAGVPAKVALLN